MSLKSWLVFGAGLWLNACGSSDKASSTMDGSGGVGGTSGSTASANGSEESTASGGAGGSGGSAANTSGSGGSTTDGSAGAAGQVGVDAGSNFVLPDRGAWPLTSGDALNATPPVLAPSKAGIIVAGATRDPATAGVSEFAVGIEGEAFLMEIDHDGEAAYRVILEDAGMPSSVAVDGDGNIVVLAPYLPDVTSIFRGQYSSSGYLAKLDADGNLSYERELAFGTGTILEAVAVDEAGDIYIGGSRLPDDDFPNEYPFVAKYDADGQELWTRAFEHDGTTAYVAALGLAPEGDVVFAGSFNGSMDLGGGMLESDAGVGATTFPNGYVARLTSSGDYVYAQRFGGTIFDGATALVTLDNGDVLLSGYVSGVSSVGGLPLSADLDEGSAFVARLDEEGEARWVELAAVRGAGYGIAKDADETHVYVVGDLGGSDYLVEYSSLGEKMRTASLASGLITTHSVTVDPVGSVWVAASFSDDIDFGNGNALAADMAGTCIVRLDR